MATSNKSLIVVTWDGQAQPLNHIYQDTAPAFDFLVFDAILFGTFTFGPFTFDPFTANV